MHIIQPYLLDSLLNEMFKIFRQHLNFFQINKYLWAFGISNKNLFFY